MKHTKTFRWTLAGFGLTWHRKVHFSTFSGKLTFQCTRNGPQNPPFCPGSPQDTFILYSSISRATWLSPWALGNMLVGYRWINNKGVLDTPWTIWKVLRASSSTLKSQFTGKYWKVDFPMPCKTKSCQSSTECLRMLRALLPDTPRPPQFQPELQFCSLFVENSIFPGSLTGA